MVIDDDVVHFTRDSLAVEIHPSEDELAKRAAILASEIVANAIEERGSASVILATANSQVKFLEALVRGGDSIRKIDWSKVTLFHMDEYLGLSSSHSASFRRYMKENVEAKLKPFVFHYLEGDADQPLKALRAYSDLLSENTPDLCCLGIGENGHIAFNDPDVADFEDSEVVKIVKLDQECRQQQVGEGHFPTLDHVPMYAMTLTIPTLCSARHMIAIVPERRKAKAVQGALEEPVSTICPASYLRTQKQCVLLLDPESSGLISI